MSVVKVIRLCDILQLKPILTDPKLDVKVIVLSILASLFAVYELPVIADLRFHRRQNFIKTGVFQSRKFFTSNQPKVYSKWDFTYITF